MCFSATASFVTAGVTGAIGIVSLSRTKDVRELPLAATPLVFALQQGLEGMLWLNLPVVPGAALPTFLIFAFLIVAEAVWPVYAPVTVLLVEPDRRRRRLMLGCLATGAAVGTWLLWSILAQPHTATAMNGHIIYVSEYQHSYIIGLAYLAATGLPLILSSRRTLVVMGVIILIGSVTAYVFYWEAFVSVWCFFAAAASVVILAHFEWSRRQRLLMVPSR